MKMESQTYEIKVAFLGHDGAGKLTLINAILQDQYAEVSMMIRTNATNVHCFRIFPKQNTRDSALVIVDVNRGVTRINMHDMRNFSGPKFK
jgi:GTPase SAR1 family protein